jgi:DNA-binding response OmpR family regulator
MNSTVLCVSHDAASLLLYRSILELEGHTTLGVVSADEALKISEGIAIACVVVDCGDNGISVTRKIAVAMRGIPILFVSDQSEVELQVYAETGMFVTKEEAIGELSRCIAEGRGHSGRRYDRDRRKLARIEYRRRHLARGFGEVALALVTEVKSRIDLALYFWRRRNRCRRRSLKTMVSW